jgi:copper chaperone CopZ
MAEGETTVEFAVNLTCSNCVKVTEQVLKAAPGIADFNVDLVINGSFINDVI